MNGRRTAIVAALFVILISNLNAQDVKAEVKVEENYVGIDPVTIEIYAEDVTDFLDINLQEYAIKAWEAYEEGDYEKSAQHYLALLHYNVTQPVVIYNLACCYGLLGKDELAARNLERAFSAGYRDIEHILKDPDFDNVKDSPRFSAVLDSLASLMEEKYITPSETVFNQATCFVKCPIRLPSNFDSTRSYPLVVGLHGWGSNSDGFMNLWEIFDDPDFIYAVPQAPYAFSTGKEIGFSWEEWIPDEDELTLQARQLSENYVIDVVKNLENTHKIKKIYLMGFSQGGSFTYSIGIKNHEAFDGIISLGGWLDTEWIGDSALTNASQLPVFIGHGKNDKRVDLKSAKKAKQMLEELGYDVTFYTFKGGHSVPAEEAEAMIEWIEER